MWTARILIRLGGCPGWSESSLGAHAILLVLSWGGSDKGLSVEQPHKQPLDIARNIALCQKLLLNPYSVNVNWKSFAETGQLCWLNWASAVYLCEKYLSHIGQLSLFHNPSRINLVSGYSTVIMHFRFFETDVNALYLCQIHTCI